MVLWSSYKKLKKNNRFFLFITKFLHVILFKFIFLKENIFYLFVTIYYIIFHKKNILWIHLLSYYLISLVITIIINFYIFNFRINSQDEVLKKKFTILTNNLDKHGKTLIEKQLKDLEVGNIIKLYENDICPANILIITNQHKMNKKDIGFVEDFLINEKVKVIKKKGLGKFKPKYILENSIDFRKLFNKLTFTLEYNNLSDFDNFRALLKIKKDPKPENITIDNIIKKDSIIRSKWILGILLDLNNNRTKGYMENLKKKTKFEKMFNTYFLQLILITIFLQFFFFIFIADVNWFELSHYYNFLFTLFIFIPHQVKNLISFCEMIKVLKINESYLKKENTLNIKDFKKMQISCTSEFNCTPRKIVEKKKKKIRKNKTLFKGKSQIIKRKSIFNNEVSFIMSEYKNNKKSVMKIINPKILTEIVNVDTVIFSKSDYISQKLLKVKTISTIDCFFTIKYLKEGEGDKSEQEQNFCVIKKKIKTAKNKKNLNTTQSIKNPTLLQPEKKKNNYIKEELDLINKNLSTDSRRNGKILSMSDLTKLKIDSKKKGFMYESKTLKLNELNNNEFILEKNKSLKNLLINMIQITDYAMIVLKSDIFSTLSYLDKSLSDFYGFFNFSIIDLQSLNSLAGFEVQIKQDKFYYVTKILHINTLFDNSTLRIYVLDIETKIITVYIRTTEFSILSKYLKNSDKNIIIKKIYHKNKDKNLKTIIFLKTELDSVQSSNLLDEYEKLIKKKINPDHFLANYFEINIKTLEFFGAVGIREYIKKDIGFFEDLKKANIRLGYLTNDKIENPDTVLKRLNMDVKQSTQVRLNFKNIEDGKLRIREIFIKNEDIFKEISNDNKNVNQKKIIYLTKNNLFYNKKLCLNISGPTLNIIYSDSYLFYNFKLLLKYSNSFIAHNLKRSQKKFIIELLQDIERKKNILVIGSGEKDREMMSKADISVQYDVNNSTVFGDILVSELKDLSPIIFVHSQLFYKNLFVFVQNIFFTAFFFIFQCCIEVFMEVHYVSLPNTGSLFFQNLYPFIIGIYFILSNEDDFGQIRLNSKILYQEINLFKKNCLQIIWFNIFEALFLSLLIFLSVFYLTDSIFNGPYSITNYTIKLCLMILNFFILTLRINFLVNKTSIPLYLLFIVNIIVNCVFFIFSMSFNENSINFEYIGYIFEIEFLVILISFLIVTFVFCYIYNYAFNKFKVSLLCKFKEEEINLQNNKIVEDNFLENYFMSEKNQFFPKTLFRIYKITKCIEPFLMNIIYPMEMFDYNNLNKLSLNFKNSFIEKTFYYTQLKKNKNTKALITLILSLIVPILYLTRFTCDIKKGEWAVEYIAIFFVISMHTIIIKFATCENRLDKYTIPLIFITEIFLFASFAETFNHLLVFQFFNTIFISQLCDFSFFTYLCMVIFRSSFFIIILFISYSINKEDIFFYLIILFSFIFFQLVIVFYNYYFHKINKKSMILKFKLKKKSNYNNDLLTFLMPKFILSKIKFDLNETHLAEDSEKIVVMFVYICNFDSLLKEYKNNIIGLLDNVYKDFDILCSKYGVQKIETVGNTYMAACGGKIGEEDLSSILRKKDPIKRMFDLSVSFTNIIGNYKDENGKKLKLKIGIHVGNCIMGVIGYHKPQFSLIGDTINTTSRVCSTGIDEHIMLSQEAYALLKKFLINSKFKVESKLTFMKGKGNQPVYHIYKKPSFKKYMKIAILNIKNKNICKKFDKLSKPKLQAKKKSFQNVFSKFNNMKEVIPMLRKKRERLTSLKISTNRKDQIKNFIQKNSAHNSKELQKSSNRSFSIEDFEVRDSKKNLDNLEFDPIITGKNLILEKLKNSFLDKYYKSTDNNHLYLNNIYFIFFFFVSSLTILNCFLKYKSIILLIIMGLKCLLGLIAIFFVIIFKKIFNRKFKSIVSFYMVFNFVIIQVLIFLFYKEFVENDILIIFLEELFISLYFIYSQLFCYKYLLKFICFFSLTKIILTIIVLISIEEVDHRKKYLFLEILVCWIFINFALKFKKSMNVLSEIKYFNRLNLEKEKSSQINDFINRLLPVYVQEILTNPHSKLAETYDNVTIIYADICGFTSYSSTKSPKKVVDLLDKLFTDFDKSCDSLQLYKVYTIGDCYVALGFLDKDKRIDPHEEAYKIIQFGFKMRDIITNVRKLIKFDELDMRIGIHTGKVIGGVIGTDIIRYDIYGEDVSIANKMESSGQKGKINISGTTKELVQKNYPEEFEITKNKTITNYSKKIDMYFIENKVS